MANKWFAAILGLILPPLAFVYLANLRIAALYFILLVCSAIADFYIEPAIGLSLRVLLAVVATIHAFNLAKSIDKNEPMNRAEVEFSQDDMPKLKRTTATKFLVVIIVLGVVGLFFIWYVLSLANGFSHS